jgi:hypothetical protein
MILIANTGMVVSRDTLSLESPGAVRRAAYQGSDEGLYNIQVRLCNKTGGATVAGRVYKLAYDGDEETNPKAVAVVTLANVYQKVVVAMEVIADGSFGWFCYQGYCDAFCEGTTDVDKDDFLTCNDATDDDAFIEDTTTRTVNSMAIACAVQASATPTLTRIYLFGDDAIIP